MGQLIEFITPLHTKASRNYIERMVNEKVLCSKKAREFDRDFWDGERRFGYGGYRYDGRWQVVAEAMIKQYNLKSDAKVLDVGCGKGFLMYEFKKLLPNAVIKGFDISDYAIKNSKDEVREDVFVHNAKDPYPFQDNEFDLVLSLTTLFNLTMPECHLALKEIERVSQNAYISLESYRNEDELFNLQCWALTCELFFRPDEWLWVFNQAGYTGDYEFIYFE